MLDRDLRDLRRDLKVTRKAAFAAGTHKNHLTQWRTYLSFCLYFSLDFLPATVDTICLFCQFLNRSLTPASVRNYLSGVKFLHVALGHDSPRSKRLPLESRYVVLTGWCYIVLRVRLPSHPSFCCR